MPERYRIVLWMPNWNHNDARRQSEVAPGDRWITREALYSGQKLGRFSDTNKCAFSAERVSCTAEQEFPIESSSGSAVD